MHLSPSVDSASISSSVAAAIGGGVGGGILVFLSICVLTWRLCKKSKKKGTTLAMQHAPQLNAAQTDGGAKINEIKPQNMSMHHTVTMPKILTTTLHGWRHISLVEWAFHSSSIPVPQ